MRAVFIGTNNRFNTMMTDWLARRTELAGAVWTVSSSWERSFKGRIDHARKRAKKYGWWKVMGEALFFIVYHRLFSKANGQRMNEKILNPYFEKHREIKKPERTITTDNVNSSETLEFIRSCKPDVIFAMCTNDYFGKKLRSIPKHGCLLWHEGITPEYKGLYSPFWAIHNRDIDNVGYSLLEMTDKLDAGRVFVQGKAKDIAEDLDKYSYVGHKAIYDSLEEVDKLIKEMEREEHKGIERPASKEGYYTYPGIIDLLRYRSRAKKLKNSDKK